MPLPRPSRKPRAPKAGRGRPPARISGTARVTITGAEAPTAAEPARFSMVAYTGEPMRINSWSDPVVVDLETADTTEQRIPALYDHWAGINDIVGQVEDLAVQDRQLVASGRFTPLPPVDGRPSRADEVLALARTGYQWQASVGADPATVEEIKAGAVGVANWGRQYPGPCVIGRGCKFRELSFVVLGGDRRTSVVTSRLRSNRTIKGSAVNPTYEEWLLTLGFEDPSVLTPTQDSNLRLLYAEEYPEAAAEGEPAPATPPEPASVGEQVAATADGDALDEEEEETVTARGQRPAVRGAARPAPQPARRTDAVADHNRRIAANMARVDAITAIAARYPRVTVAAGRQRVPLATHAVAQNWTPQQTELYALQQDRPSHVQASAASGGADQLRPLVIEAALCLNAGVRGDVIAPRLRDPATGAILAAADQQRVMNQATSADYQGYSLHCLMDATIRANGQHYHGARKTNSFVRAALEADRDGRRMIRASGTGFTTISLTGILSNVANKLMIAAYEAQAVTWREWVAVRSYADFKPVTSYRLDMTGAFKKVGPDGELKHVGMAETGYTNKLDTFGAIIALTRQMQINDDLGAFARIPIELGIMSAGRVEEGAYVLLLSNPSSFFHANNANLLTGAGSAFDTDALTASETAFMNQTRNGKPILSVPDRVLVPTTLGVPANILYKNTTVYTDGANVAYADNPHAGKYRPVVSPFLNNAAIRDQDGAALSGQSATAWYQFVNPAVRAAFVVGFLNGQETPTIEDDETSFETLGRQWRAYHDFGFGAEDTTAAVKNAGA